MLPRSSRDASSLLSRCRLAIRSASCSWSRCRAKKPVCNLFAREQAPGKQFHPGFAPLVETRLLVVHLIGLVLWFAGEVNSQL